jgi:ABC-2 type transport system permease protein
MSSGSRDLSSTLERGLRMLKTVKKYLSLYISFIRASFIADLEYRMNFITRIVTDIFWYLGQILTFEVLYSHTNMIGDWNLQQMRVFLGVVFVVDSIYMLTLHDNLDSFSDKVRTGQLDLLLVKPINSQFMLSLQRVSTSSLMNMLMALGWLGWSLARVENMSPINILYFLLLVPSGVISLYVMRFFFTSIAIVLTRAENFHYLWYQLYRLGLRPDSIYSPWLRFLVLTLLPVGIIASVPARALLNAHFDIIAVWALICGPGLLYLSHRYWKWLLTHYTSASS